MLTQHDVQRGAAATRRPGLFVLIAAALSVAVHAWLIRTVFVPIAKADDIDYVFVSATGGSFVSIVLITSALVFVAHALVRRSVTPPDVQPALFSNEDVAYARPLLCFAASLLSLLHLVRPPIRFLPVVSYVIVDLRWWWTALVAAWFVGNLDRRVNGAWRRRIASIRLPPIVRRWAPHASLAAIAVMWSVAGTPILRDLGGTIGDESQYVRYCENLYQGLGFESSQVKPNSVLPEDFSPRLNPGLPFLMFPACYLDRQFTQIEPGSPVPWPTHLPSVNAFFLAVYAAWTILIFQFLRMCGATTATAWIASLACTLTLPASALPFQYYPELVAGLFMSAVGSHLLFGHRDRPRRSFCSGLLVGYLPWLHVRFSLVMLALVFGAFVLWRGQWRRLLFFLMAVTIPVVLFSMYAYRISGSAMPAGLWSAKGSGENVVFMEMVKNSVAYLVDRDWGLFAHSPVFLMALPGYWWLARRNPRVAFLCALVLLALLLPAAGSTFVQTTPMRPIAAVVPLGATPMIELLRRRSPAVLMTFGLLLILSLDNALAYNLHHYRHIDTLVDWSFSGWKVNLLFPQESRQPWQISAANGVLLVVWIVALPGLLCAPALVQWARERRWSLPPAVPTARSLGRPAFGVVALVVALGTAVSAATGTWTRRPYFIPSDEAAQQAASALDALGQCTLCLSSQGGRMTTRRMLAALEAVDPLVATRQRPAVGERGYQVWLAMPGQIRSWFIEANGHEPGNEDVGRYLFQWREDRASPTEIRRRIFAAAGKTP
jgi:hypothetical protein